MTIDFRVFNSIDQFETFNTRAIDYLTHRQDHKDSNGQNLSSSEQALAEMSSFRIGEQSDNVFEQVISWDAESIGSELHQTPFRADSIDLSMLGIFFKTLDLVSQLKEDTELITRLKKSQNVNFSLILNNIEQWALRFINKVFGHDI